MTRVPAIRTARGLGGALKSLEAFNGRGSGLRGVEAHPFARCPARGFGGQGFQKGLEGVDFSLAGSHLHVMQSTLGERLSLLGKQQPQIRVQLPLFERRSNTSNVVGVLVAGAMLAIPAIAEAAVTGSANSFLLEVASLISSYSRPILFMGFFAGAIMALAELFASPVNPRLYGELRDGVAWYGLEELLGLVRAAKSLDMELDYKKIFDPESFRAEIDRVLGEYRGEIIYDPHEDIFQSPNPLRGVAEGTSNGLDALEGAGEVFVEAGNGHYSIREHGIGMGLRLLMEEFFVTKLTGKDKSQEQIGRFGVGFYTTLRHLYDGEGNLKEGAEVVVETRESGAQAYRLMHRVIGGKRSVGLQRLEADYASKEIGESGTRVSVAGYGIDEASVRRELTRYFEYTDSGRVVTLNGKKINHYEVERDLGRADGVGVKLMRYKEKPRVIIKVADVMIEEYDIGDGALPYTLLLEFKRLSRHSLMREEVEVNGKMRRVFEGLLTLTSEFELKSERIAYLNTLAPLARGLETNGRNRSGVSFVDLLRSKVREVSEGSRIYPVSMSGQVKAGGAVLFVDRGIIPHDYLEGLRIPEEFHGGTLLMPSGIMRELRFVLTDDLNRDLYLDEEGGVFYLSKERYGELDETVLEAFAHISEERLKIRYNKKQSICPAEASTGLKDVIPAVAWRLAAPRMDARQMALSRGAEFLNRKQIPLEHLMPHLQLRGLQQIRNTYRVGIGYVAYVAERGTTEKLHYIGNGINRIPFDGLYLYLPIVSNNHVFYRVEDKYVNISLFSAANIRAPILKGLRIFFSNGYFYVFTKERRLEVYKEEEYSSPVASVDVDAFKSLLGIEYRQIGHSSGLIKCRFNPMSDAFFCGEFLAIELDNQYKLYSLDDLENPISINGYTSFLDIEHLSDNYFVFKTEDCHMLVSRYDLLNPLLVTSGTIKYQGSEQPVIVVIDEAGKRTFYNKDKLDRPIVEVARGQKVLVYGCSSDGVVIVRTPETGEIVVYDMDGRKFVLKGFDGYHSYDFEYYSNGLLNINLGDYSAIYNIYQSLEPLLYTRAEISFIDGYFVVSNYKQTVVYSTNNLNEPILVINEDAVRVSRIYMDGDDLKALFLMRRKQSVHVASSDGSVKLFDDNTVIVTNRSIDLNGIQQLTIHATGFERVLIDSHDPSSKHIFEPDRLALLSQEKYQRRVLQLKEKRLPIFQHADAIFAASDEAWDMLVNDSSRRRFLPALAMPYFDAYVCANPDANVRTLSFLNTMIRHFAPINQDNSTNFMQKAERLLASKINTDELVRDLQEDRQTDLRRAIALYFSSEDGELLLPGEARIEVSSRESMSLVQASNAVRARGAKCLTALALGRSSQVDARLVRHAAEHLNTGNPYVFVREQIRVLERLSPERIDVEYFENRGHLHTVLSVDRGLSEEEFVPQLLNPESGLGRAVLLSMNGSEAVRVRSIKEGREIRAELSRGEDGNINIRWEQASSKDRDEFTVEVVRSSDIPLLEAAYFRVYAEALGMFYKGRAGYYLNAKHMNEADQTAILSPKVDGLGHADIYNGISSRLLLGGLMIMEMPERIWDGVPIGIRTFFDKQGICIDMDPEEVRLIPSGERFENHDALMNSLGIAMPGIAMQVFLKRVMTEGRRENLNILPDVIFAAKGYRFDWAYDQSLVADADAINDGDYASVDYTRYEDSKELLKLIVRLNFIPDIEAVGRFISIVELRERLHQDEGLERVRPMLVKLPREIRARLEREIAMKQGEVARQTHLPVTGRNREIRKDSLPEAYRIYFGLVEDILRAYYTGEVVTGVHTYEGNQVDYARHYERGNVYHLYRTLGDYLHREVTELMQILQIEDSGAKEKAFRRFLAKLIEILTHELTHVVLGTNDDVPHEASFYAEQRRILISKRGEQINRAEMLRRALEKASTNPQIPPWQEIMEGMESR